MKVSHGNFTVGLFSVFFSVDDDDETIRIVVGRGGGGVNRPSIS